MEVPEVGLFHTAWCPGNLHLCLAANATVLLRDGPCGHFLEMQECSVHAFCAEGVAHGTSSNGGQCCSMLASDTFLKVGFNCAVVKLAESWYPVSMDNAECCHPYLPCAFVT